MSLFTTENQTSSYYKDPTYYNGSGFVLGMLGYKKNGQKSLFGKIKDVALPVIGGIAGTIVGGPAGTAIGSAIGQGLNAASNKAASDLVGNAEDSQAAIDNDLSGTLARGNLGLSLSSLAGGATAGAQKGMGIGKLIKSLGPTISDSLPGIGSGLAGAIGANGITTVPVGQKVRYFKKGGEVGPLTYKLAGMTFSTEKPDYKVYDEGDSSEDLVISHKDTGTYYGQMRIGERLFPQHSNLAMKAIMRSSASDLQKKAALGEHVYDELVSQESQESTNYAGGGDTPPDYKARSLDEAFQKAKAARQPTFVHQGKVYRAIDLDPMAGSWATPPKTVASPQSELDRYRQSTYGRSRAGETAAPVTPPVAATNGTPLKAPMQNVEKPAASRPAIPRTVQRGARAGAPVAKGTKPVSAVSSGVISKMTHQQMVSTLGTIKKPDVDTVGDVPTVEPVTKTIPKPTEAGKIALGQTVPVASTNYDPHTDIKPVEPETKSNLGANLLDLGRIATGAVMASKKTPTYQLPARFMNWQSQVEQKANQGYSAPEWNTINGQITDTYAAGVNGMTNTLGSGATPGVVLAGLTRLGQQRGQQTQAAVVGDVGRRVQNFAQYGGMVNQDLALDQQQFDNQLAQTVSGQQAGVALAQSGMANIGQRQLYDQNYGDGSLYQKLMQSQVDKETEASDTLKAMRKQAMMGALSAA